jgi:hypothetical protein
VQRLRTRYPDFQFPDIDQMHAGIDAWELFLFEQPGAMTAEVGRGEMRGSGLKNRDNNDPTADATFHLMQAAGLLRAEIVIGNAIPGWYETRRATGCE